MTLYYGWYSHNKQPVLKSLIDDSDNTHFAWDFHNTTMAPFPQHVRSDSGIGQCLAGADAESFKGEGPMY